MLIWAAKALAPRIGPARSASRQELYTMLCEMRGALPTIRTPQQASHEVTYTQLLGDFKTMSQDRATKVLPILVGHLVNAGASEHKLLTMLVAKGKEPCPDC